MIIAQAALALVVAMVGVHAGLLLHDAVPSAIRTGVSSGAGTLSWVLFLPFSLVLGWLIRAHGVHLAGWVLIAVAGCDGCTTYLRQIRATIDALARLDGGPAFVPPGPGHRS